MFRVTKSTTPIHFIDPQVQVIFVISNLTQETRGENIHTRQLKVAYVINQLPLEENKHVGTQETTGAHHPACTWIYKAGYKPD